MELTAASPSFFRERAGEAGVVGATGAAAHLD
jgi:hypothetical protein